MAWVAAGVRGLPLLGRTITATSRHRHLWAVVRTAALSLLVLVVFGALFSAADAVFGHWADALVPAIAWDTLLLRGFVWFVVGGVVLAGSYLALNPPRVDRLALPAGRPVARRWEWLVPVGVLLVLFAGFLAAQASAMWGGHEYLRRTTGLSYGDYVHQGFGQLVVVTVLTLVVIAVAARKAPRREPADRLTLRVVLGLLCVLTLVVVASALYRMHVYQVAYGFTTLRLVVDVFEAWLGLLVVLVLLGGVRLSGWWVPRAALISGAVLVLGLGLLNPDGFVARHNLERWHATGRLDAAYLASLGDDAAPTVAGSALPQELRACVLAQMAASHSADDVLSWNLGRARAAAVLPPASDTDPTCPELLLDTSAG
ncbi:Sensor protein (fragment) [Nostocoides japonicum T1-X7]|uniref:Sensor protein n=1 Tax=Nostocoides japonicum T1-X7 TaxID=1194083 RepID=A0A077M2K5_9MICO